MKTLPKRLENAVTKLYNAFHANELDAMDCYSCAVGNLLEERRMWRMNSFEVKCGIEKMPRNLYNPPTHPDYSEIELFNIEKIFLTEWLKEKSDDGEDKQIQFKGLCAVVKYLCELDGVENIMEIQSLFEFDENKKPINQLTF